MKPPKKSTCAANSPGIRERLKWGAIEKHYSVHSNGTGNQANGMGKNGISYYGSVSGLRYETRNARYRKLTKYCLLNE